MPSSRLVLQCGGLQDPGTRRVFEALFSRQGIEPARLELRGWSPYAELLAEYNDIDLALDPFPFAGGATSCEALWMGVPVITSPGDTFAGRRTYSYLSSIGLTETVAEDLTHYARLAIHLAQDLPRLAGWRAELRERMARSLLCDGARLAANLAGALRAAWRRWCTGEQRS